MHKTTLDKVALSKTLYERILYTLQPGDKLPSERQLTAELNVGRNSLREALRQFQALGLVDIRHGSGYYRSDINMNSLLLPISDQLAQKRILVEEIVETRMVIELAILRLAFQRSTMAELDTIGRYLETGLSLDSNSAPDLRFEELLGEMVGNPILSAMQRLLHLVWKDVTRRGWRHRDKAENHNDHVQIFRSICARDLEKAEQLMTDHLRYAVVKFIQLNATEENPSE